MLDQMTVASLFDAAWYFETYLSDIQDCDPWEHFRQVGAAAGFDPNPMFSVSWYLRRYRDVTGSGLDALADYLSRGAMLGRDPGPLFNTRWYLASNPDVAAAGVNPLQHYLSNGWHELRDPSPVFNTAWYFASYPAAAAAGFDARIHYFERGAFLGYSPCPLFESQWYMDTYPELAAEKINPLLHYLTEGVERGFDPSPHFSTLGYLESHPEVAASGENPLVHHLANEPPQNRTSVHAAVGLPAPLSRAAVADVRALIEAMSAIEPDLAALPKPLETLAVATWFAPDRCTAAWRRLYLSIYELPQRLVFVGAIDNAPELAALLKDTSGTLIIETDAQVVSTAELLPSHTQWRSLSEFAVELDAEDRIRLATALVNGLQPAALLVWGSRIGWEMLARHGRAFRSNTALFGAFASAPEISAVDLLRSYFRSCISVISALYSADEQELRRFAALFGLPSSEYWKLRDLKKCWEDRDFFAQIGAPQ